MPLPDNIKIPESVAIIMDGNGRWAQNRGLPRIKGHEKGAETVRKITEEASRLKLKELTLYSLSLDNLNRPHDEIYALLELFKKYLINERKTIMENNIVFTVIGKTNLLPYDVCEEMNKTIKLSSKNTGLILRLAINYSGKQEILDAVHSMLKNGVNNVNVNEEYFKKFLYDPRMKEPDLLIRTGGQYRISGFLLWHISYTELWFTDVYWPDFEIDIFYQALQDYSKRERKFGRTHPLT